MLDSDIYKCAYSIQKVGMAVGVGRLKVCFDNVLLDPQISRLWPPSSSSHFGMLM